MKASIRCPGRRGGRWPQPTGIGGPATQGFGLCHYGDDSGTEKSWESPGLDNIKWIYKHERIVVKNRDILK